MRTKRRLGGIDEMGGDGEKKGGKVGTNHIQQSTKLVVALEGRGGVAQMGGDDDR